MLADVQQSDALTKTTDAFSLRPLFIMKGITKHISSHFFSSSTITKIAAVRKSFRSPGLTVLCTDLQIKAGFLFIQQAEAFPIKE